MSQYKEFSTEKLHERLQEVEWEIENLYFERNKLENELYYREHPEVRPKEDTNYKSS